MHLLPVSLAPLAAICSKDASRFSTNGVSLTVHQDNTFTAIATDCKSAIRVVGNCAGDQADYPTFPALASSPNGECSSIIPAKDWKQAFTDAGKLSKRTGKPILQSNAVVIGKDVTSFGATDLERIAFSQPRNIEGRFPALDKVIPANRNDALWSVRVDPVLLANILTTIDKLNVQNDQTSVDLDFHGKPDCVSLIVARYQDTTQKIDGAIVPLTYTEGPCKGKTDCRPRDIEESVVENMTDDDKREIGWKAANEELRRKLAHEEQRADYFRNQLEELRAGNPDCNPGNALLAMLQGEIAELKNQLAAKPSVSAGDIQSENDELRRQIEELQTDLENARTEQEAQAGSEMAKLRERAEDAEKELAKLEKEIDDTEYDNVPQMLAEINKAQDKAADLDNAMAIEGVRLTTAWKRIEQLERVNGLLRSNFDRMVATMK